MSGRIRKKQIQEKLEALPQTAGDDSFCPLCDRIIPPQQRDAHHLIPKSKGGVQTVVMHRICHRQIHSLLTEAELANDYFTVESLKQQNEIASFITWVKRKPVSFFEKSRKSQRLRKR